MGGRAPREQSRRGRVRLHGGPMIVRLERVEDRAASIQVEPAAFPTAEEATIVEQVRDEPGSFALVAEQDGVTVGHVQLSAAWIGGAEVLALGPIGVAPRRQGQRIGSTLLEDALSEAGRREPPLSSCSGPRRTTAPVASNRPRATVSRICSPACDTKGARSRRRISRSQCWTTSGCERCPARCAGTPRSASDSRDERGE